jgi:tetratricopeptide (TPR) repeat protein
VKEIAQILSNLPIKSYQAIGHYYLAVSYNRCGNGDLEKAKGLLTFAADTAPLHYRAKAMLSLAAVSAHLKKPDAALYYFTETLKTSKDISTSLIAYHGIVVHKSREGYHKQALADLESILPVIKYAPAHIYFDLLNSYAVELGEVGRKDEARNIMRVVMASPLAVAYPMWRETAEDLKPSRRSMVTVGQIHSNVLAMPEREHGEQSPLQPKPARVVSFAKGKKKMDKKDKDEKIQKSIAEMNFKDLGFKLLELITTNQADEDQMRLIVTFAMSLFSEPVKPPDKPSA